MPDDIVPAPQPTPNANVIGGPEDISKANPAPAATAPVVEAAPAAGSAQPVIIGDRVFTDQAAALKYADELAKERQRYLNQMGNPAPVVTQPAAPKKMPLHQLMFEDPEAALNELRSEIKQEMRNETATNDFKKNTWDNFYGQNKDLKGLEDVVELVMAKNADRIKNLSVEEGLKFVAAQARSRVANIRGSANLGERVNDGPAPVAGATGTPAQRTEVQTPSGQGTFMDELRDFRNSKRTKQSKGA